MDPIPDSIKPHPRLILSPEKIASLKEQIKTDPVSRRMFECMRRKSEQFLDAPPVIHQMEGRRLLMQSRLCLERVSILSLTASLTGDDRFIRRAIREMEAAADFPDWNPSHFLDTGEMTLALALGYDWLFDHLTDGEKNRIASAIRLKGLEPSLLTDTQPSWTWWIQGTNNWTQVCHAGMVAGALALQENDPQLAREFVRRAVENIPRASAAYAPDGAYAEGPMYWSYGTSFHVVLIDLLTSVTGDDSGLADSPGFLASAGYIAKTTAPTGLFYNYSDCRDLRSFEVPLFWFARRLDAPELVTYELAMMEAAFVRYEAGPANHHENSYRLFPLALIWWKPAPASSTASRPAPALHWLGRGVNPVAIHRSAWNDPRAVYIGIKGGSASSPHAHMDAGSFILEAEGVRWAIDPGLQEYHGLEIAGVGLWDAKQDGGRWKIFRYGSQGHNVLTFNGAQQSVKGNASIVRFHASGPWPHTVIDLSSTYEGQAGRVMRGVSLLENRHVLFQDEWTAGETAVTVRWQMLTKAEVSVSGAEITLSQEGKHLRLKTLEPADAKISIIDVSKPQMPYDAKNPDLKAITVECQTLPSQAGGFRILASPLDGGQDMPVEIPHVPLDEWSAPLA